MISRDVKVLDRESGIFLRMQEYASLFDELHIVVMGTHAKVHNVENSKNLFFYNRTSALKTLSLFKTFFTSLKLGKKLKGGELWITSQDPFEAGLVATMVAKIRKIKLQLQLHTDCFNQSFIKHSFKNFIQAVIARMIISKADSVRVVSERIKESILNLEALPPEKIFVLPIFVDMERMRDENIDYDLREKFPEFKRIVLVVARLETEKNIPLALTSFQKMLRHDDTIGLVIAGTGSKLEYLVAYAKHLDIFNKVRFVGFVPNISSLYKTSDVLLVTSFYEGFGLSIVEALSLGIKVVSTDVGVAREAGAKIVSYDGGEIAMEVLESLTDISKPSLQTEYMLTKQEYQNQFRNTFV